MNKTFLSSAMLGCFFLLSPAFAQEKFTPAEGVTVGKVAYVTGEKATFPELEAAIAKAVAASPGQEIRYIYNILALSPRPGRQVFVVLLGPDWGGTGGSTALLFDSKQIDLPAKYSYTLVNKFSLFNGPLSLGPGQKQKLERLDLAGKRWRGQTSLRHPEIRWQKVSRKSLDSAGHPERNRNQGPRLPIRQHHPQNRTCLQGQVKTRGWRSVQG